MSRPDELVACPHCERLRRTTAVACTGCGLPAEPRCDIAWFEAELRNQSRRILATAAAMIGLLALTFAVLRGAACLALSRAASWTPETVKGSAPESAPNRPCPPLAPTSRF